MRAAFRLWRRFAFTGGIRVTDVLAIIAFAATTAVSLIVVSGVLAFYARGQSSNDPEALLLFSLSLVAAALLLPAVAVLATAAVRLAVSRRDARLSALRLAGATRGQVTTIAVADAGLQALIGALIGVGLSYVLTPAIALINFQGRPFAPGELTVPWWISLLCVAAVCLIGLGSALLSLIRVAISPLGVAERVTPKGLSWIRAAVVVVALVAYGVVTNAGGAGVGVMIALLAIAVLAVIFVGPLIVMLAATIVAKFAKSPATLIAARRLQDDPRGAFNVVGAMSIAVMVGGLASLVSAFPDDGMADIATGAMLTIAISGVLGAVLAGVSQAAKILDQRGEYRALHLIGAELGQLHSARIRETSIPLIVMVGSTFVGTIVLLTPMIGLWIGNPESVLTFIGMTLAACAIVVIATLASSGLMRRVATQDA
ncbi:FtsX-like permease family protein [Humidisolicoccus flavus]|uniref:FtsX-like permease family protein n=1 Tax=Humidisolicoccus flavus TaxID=3111414 RepID=UPI00325498FF